MIAYIIKGSVIGIMFQGVVAAIRVWTDQPDPAYAAWVSVAMGAVIAFVACTAMAK